MEKRVDRREFLKASVGTGALLVMGDILKGDAMAQKPGKIVEADKVNIWVLTDNYYDALLPDARIATRYRILPGKSIHAEHGLSYYVETSVNGKTSAFMFDYGLDPVGVTNNMSLLGIDVGRVDAFVLSHGHFDHFMAASQILKANRAMIRKNAPFYLGEEAFSRRFLAPPGGGKMMDLGQLKRQDIEDFGPKVTEIKDAIQIIPGAYTTGNIQRTTSYEKIPPSLLIKRGETPEPDDFRGEQAVFFKIRDKGLVVLSGCAHRGIVNTVKQAQRAAGTEKIHAVLGGFHLIGAKPENIRQTVADIKAMKPDYIAPTHCTSFAATNVFAQEMPGEFVLNTAGAKYTFGA